MKSFDEFMRVRIGEYGSAIPESEKKMDTLFTRKMVKPDVSESVTAT